MWEMQGGRAHSYGCKACLGICCSNFYLGCQGHHWVMVDKVSGIGTPPASLPVLGLACTTIPLMKAKEKVPVKMVEW